MENTAIALEPGQQVYESSSALADLQLALISNNPIDADDIISAVSTDLARQVPLNQTILLKVVGSRRLGLTDKDFKRLAVIIRDAMIRVPLERADLFINYAQCAASCMNNISRK